MQKSPVAVIKCESYHQEDVNIAIKRGIDLLGGIKAFTDPDDHILLKPNLLAGEKPEKCVTTHPAVFQAIADIIQPACKKLSYGDSPAFQSMESVAQKAGISEVAQKLHITPADFKTTETVFFEGALQNKKLFLAKGVLEADGIISLAKLKTHAFSKMTGAIKNQFGCVPGLLKSEFHAKLPDLNSFSKMLVDINLYLKPRLYIMDGIKAMEGNGPRGGSPREMGIILLSQDPVALDSTVCRLIGIKPEDIPTIYYGHNSGLGTYLENEIEYLGDDWHSFICKDYKTATKPSSSATIMKRIPILRNRMLAKPVINKEKCIRCGVCVEVCPAENKAVTFTDKNIPPVYDYQNCIRCYCCQELCPHGAITVKQPFLGFRFKDI